jgi:hypothetical protein
MLRRIDDPSAFEDEIEGHGFLFNPRYRALDPPVHLLCRTMDCRVKSDDDSGAGFRRLPPGHGPAGSGTTRSGCSLSLFSSWCDFAHVENRALVDTVDQAGTWRRS